MEITKGEKVPVVYDSVGQSTFMDSLDCLAPKGLMVSFGQSSGARSALLDLGILPKKACYSSRGRHSDLLVLAKDLFDVVLSGAVEIVINQVYPLKGAARAHRDIESRKTIGFDGAHCLSRCRAGE